MRAYMLASLLLLLGGCASPLPPPDPQQAWVNLYAPAGELLMADRVDRQRWPDGRYFQVSPGPHDLQVRFQFEVNRGGGLGMSSEPLELTCEIRLRYADFKAGQRYRIEARSMAMSAQAWLYDEQRQVLTRGKVLRCGTAY
ncbi:hypothetical protein SAMN05216600_11167 [Pseudomonas cuatrocienegasensis]|uniref:Lipoprotein n=1 Tax=Pseudomonas cuatrocienegasensis TaxID=543360 RepID=A0ABY1BHH2_9PSED|nr:MULTISPECIES: hypothetical protein [Pseudomonas]OEC33022.1 hypothetical protein A7D25_20975 [Pseudomonas sp. 21C1]SEQ88397.1 hypothetical protein SAMN05216600_11167 [Pseudomonas cuatrocienegasensis]